MLAALNAAATAAFDAWLVPLAPLPSWLQLCVTAVPLTLFALLVFRWCSSQSGIRAAKDGIKGYLLEMWLYKDEPRVLLRAQGQVVLSSLEYLGHALAPLAVMLAPVALLVVQVEAHYAWRALQPGEATIVTATLAPGQPPASALDVALVASSGLAVETPPLHLDGARQLLWRVRPATPGRHELALRVGAEEVASVLVAGDTSAPLAPVAYGESDWRTLGYPAAAPLPAGAPLVAVAVDYPRRGTEVLGLSGASWLLFAATLVLGFALRDLFGVTF